jgi:hypothetical protein
MSESPITPVVAALFLLAACKSQPPPPAAADAAPASSVAAHEAAPAALDDLLHFTDARIGVSSKVDNPRDFAEHVADGRLDSAWNGKTGDLVGGWLGFRVPSAARVRVIELTVGYVATKKGEDLFTMNHRIARVRVTRNGVSLGEHALDPDSRAFQRIALDAPGGDFKLEVLAVKPGTKATWRELVVSELRVFGIAGAAKRAAATIPRVSIGGFDAPPPAAAATPVATNRSEDVPVTSSAKPDEECRTWLAPFASGYADLLDGGGSATELPWQPPEPYCEPHVEQTRGDMKLLVLRRSDLKGSWSEPAVQRGNRTFIVGRRYDTQSHFDPGCTGYSGGKLQSARIDGEAAIFVLYHFNVSNPWPQFLADGSPGDDIPGFTERSLEEVRCVFGDAGAAPTCASKKLAEKRGAFDVPVSDGPAPLPWK